MPILSTQVFRDGKIDNLVKSSWNALCASFNDINFSIKSGDYNLVIYKPRWCHAGLDKPAPAGFKPGASRRYQ
jgi:hypothetical protein